MQRRSCFVPALVGDRRHRLGLTGRVGVESGGENEPEARSQTADSCWRRSASVSYSCGYNDTAAANYAAQHTTNHELE